MLHINYLLHLKPVDERKVDYECTQSAIVSVVGETKIDDTLVAFNLIGIQSSHEQMCDVSCLCDIEYVEAVDDVGIVWRI